ncbi:MAG TPA: DUF1344 domain-containing protein [Dongiaceae bacterium]|nr:DUF1344 domain-containing protein [Dongiaceae bacterium]
MRKSSFVLGAFVTLLASSSALAMSSSSKFIPNRPQHQKPEPDADDTSTIVDIQAKSRSVALADGNKYVIPAWINLDSLKKGDTVTIVYTPNFHHGTVAVKTVNVI